MDSHSLTEIFLSMHKDYYLSREVFNNRYKGQYHISAYVLTLVHWMNHNENKGNEDKIIVECISFLDDEMMSSEGRLSADFSLESLCLSHYYAKDSYVKSVIENFLISHSHILEEHISAKAIDYYLLRYFNSLYFRRALNIEVDIPQKVNQVINKINQTSGILFDSMIGNKGYPDLAYHCRNLQIISSCYCLLEDKVLEEAVKKGFEFVSNVAAIDGRICFYGRTSELIYGDASLYMAISLVFGPTPSGIWKKIQERFESAYLSENSTQLTLSPYEKNCKSRLGYDSYVYPIVYKLFSLSRLMCAKYSSNFIECLGIKSEQSLHPVIFDFDSGFLKTRNGSYEIIMNLYGHPKSPIREEDSRCMPFFPYHHSSRGIIPDAPFKAQPKYPKENIISKLLRKWRERKDAATYTKINQGFVPVFKDEVNSFIPAECALKSNGDDSFILAVKKVYEVNNKSFKQKLVDLVKEVNCRVTLDVENKLQMFFSYERDYQAQYQISHYIKDEVQVKGCNVLINNFPVLEFSAPIRLSANSNTELNSVSGTLAVKMIDVDSEQNEFSVTYL